MVHLDINNDGLDELIVTTMYGVHILQVRASDLCEICVWVAIDPFV